MAFSDFAPRRMVESTQECFFYHTVDLPQVGLVKGLWDLRKGVEDYLGNVDFAGKRVLEFGPASGFLTFQMEKDGAEVVGYDLSDKEEWDMVPFSGLASSNEADRRSRHLRLLNNAFWLSHRLLDSKARMIYGSIYDVPPDAGPFDIAVFGSVLLHLRDPFFALQKGLALTRETVIVTDVLSRWRLPILTSLKKLLPRSLRRPGMKLIPDYQRRYPTDTWWRLEPELVVGFLGILGFERAKVTYHSQLFQGRKLPLFTVVGKRTQGSAQ